MDDIQHNIEDLHFLEGNIDTDPVFVRPEQELYHLQPGSPCIDAGDPGYPLDPDGTVADMGAFNYDQSECEYTADLDGSGFIDVIDIVILLNLILEVEGLPNELQLCAGDFDLDGLLTINDMPLISMWCGGTIPYDPELPPIEIFIDDHAELNSQGQITIPISLTNPQPVEAIQYDLIFHDIENVLLDSLSDFTNFGFINSHTVIGNHIRVVSFSLTGSTIPVSENLPFHEIYLHVESNVGEIAVTLDDIYTHGQCNQPFDAIGDTAILTEPGEPVYFDGILNGYLQDYLNFADTTGYSVESHIIIETIDNADVGDEIGLLDYNGLINFGNCENQYAEILVGAGVWQGEPLDITAYGSMDFCGNPEIDYGQYPGWVEGNPIYILYWRSADDQVYMGDYDGESGVLTWSPMSQTIPLLVPSPQVPHDVNNDGSTDILDIVMIVDYILGYSEFSDIQISSVDTNFDGEIDILDIVMIIDFILDL